MRYLSSFQLPQWGLNVKVKVTWSGTHGCSTQEAACFCECQRVNKACLASLTSVSYDQHYGKSISNSLLKFLVCLVAQLALNSFSSSCHGNSNCGFCRVFFNINNGDIWYICVYFSVGNMIIEVYFEGDYSWDIAHKEAKAADGLVPFGVKPSAVFVV